jgi:hypothetical protein
MNFSVQLFTKKVREINSSETDMLLLILESNRARRKNLEITLLLTVKTSILICKMYSHELKP